MGFWADLWSFLAAVGTVAMAGTTVAVIVQAKRHHRDRFRPVCLLLPYDGIDRRERRGELVETVNPPPQPGSFGTVAVKCLLRNIGTGPALRLRVSFRLRDVGNYATTPQEIAPLAVGEALGGEGAPLLVPVWVYEGSPFNQSDFATIPNSRWEIWLEYEDVFGRRFCSVHHKTPIKDVGIPDPYVAGYTKMLPQPWVTIHEDLTSRHQDRHALAQLIRRFRSPWATTASAAGSKLT